MQAKLIIPSLDGPFVPWAEVRAAQVWRYANRGPDPLAAALAREVGDAAVILDYGCGAGRHLRFLTGRGHGVIGIDPGAGQLEIAEQAAPRAQLYPLLFGQPIPMPSESVDGALSTWAIYHGGRAIVDWSIGEVLRVLKPGGPFFFHLISTLDFKFGRGTFLEERTFAETRAGSFGELHHFVDRSELANICKRFTRSTASHLVRPLTLEPYERSVVPAHAVCAHWVVKAWK